MKQKCVAWLPAFGLLPHPSAMDHIQMLERRTTCAGGVAASHASANDALKTLRSHALSGTAFLGGRPTSVQHGEYQYDLTGSEKTPVVPWEHLDDKGPVGRRNF